MSVGLTLFCCSVLFKLGLGIQPPSFKPFVDALIKRHDIVHRSGHDKSGNSISVTSDEIRELCQMIEQFAAEIDTKLAVRVFKKSGIEIQFREEGLCIR